MLETLTAIATAIAALVGAVGSVTAGIGVTVVNGKIDRLTAGSTPSNQRCRPSSR